MIGRVLALVLLAAAAALPTQLFAGEAAPGERRGSPVKTGEVAPDFSLADQDGRRHTLSTERGKRPVVLIFYRGYW